MNKVHEVTDAETGETSMQPLTGAVFELYKKTNGANPEWVLVEKLVIADNQTTFTWTGLDDGEYKLVESVTPAGYNTIADIFFTIDATHSETAEEPVLLTLTVDNEDFTVNFEEGTTTPTGVITTEVENKSGVELPETGGMGTTLFYTFGAMLALGAAVPLITKKRMSIAE